MKTKQSIIVIVTAIAGYACGAIEIESLRNSGPYESVILSSTNLLITFKSSGVGRWIRQKGTEIGRYSEHGEKIALTPDKEMHFSNLYHALTTFTPVIFKSKQKGFRISHVTMGAFSSQVPDRISYIALSDTPVEVGEDDVEMIMDDGEWVSTRDSKRMLLMKLGAAAKVYVKDADKIMKDEKLMAIILGHPQSAETWNILVAEGLIKTNAVDKEESSADPSSASRAEKQDDAPTMDGSPKTASPYLYVTILLFVLSAMLVIVYKR